MWESQVTHVRHRPRDMTLAVKVALNPNTTNQSLLRQENIVWKEENDAHQHFLLFP